jgi:hypothetical protein
MRSCRPDVSRQTTTLCVSTRRNLRSVRPISHACLTPVLPHELTLNSFGCSAAPFTCAHKHSHNYIQQTIRTLRVGCHVRTDGKVSVLLFQNQDVRLLGNIQIQPWMWICKFNAVFQRSLASCFSNTLQ